MGSYRLFADVCIFFASRGMSSLMPSVCYVMIVCLTGMYHNDLSLMNKVIFFYDAKTREFMHKSVLSVPASMT